MSTARHEITTVRDLMFALKGVDPATPIIALGHEPGSPWARMPAVAIELDWAGSPDKAHMIRIGTENREDIDDGR